MYKLFKPFLSVLAFSFFFATKCPEVTFKVIEGYEHNEAHPDEEREITESYTLDLNPGVTQQEIKQRLSKAIHERHHHFVVAPDTIRLYRHGRIMEALPNVFDEHLLAANDLYFDLRP